MREVSSCRLESHSDRISGFNIDGGHGISDNQIFVVTIVTMTLTVITTRVKETSLRIDEGKCLGQRLRFPYNQRCGRECSFK